MTFLSTADTLTLSSGNETCIFFYNKTNCNQSLNVKSVILFTPG